MDRLTWYTPGDSMEDILIQAGHVGIHDGEMRQVSLSLTRMRKNKVTQASVSCQ